MGKTKYHFNPKTLTLEELKVSVKHKFIKFISILTSGMVISATIMLVLYSFIDSPKEKVLKRENEKMKLQYTILNGRMDQISAILANLQSRDDNLYRTIFEAEPISDNIRKAGYGGEMRYKELKGFENSDLMINITSRLDMISRQIYIQSKSFDEIVQLAKNKEKMLLCIPAIQPVSKTQSTVVSGFGYRIHPVYKTARMHTGIDFAAKKGIPIYATGDGVVINPKGNQSGYGIVCIINHGYGFQSLYGHMSKMLVRPGEKVKRGQVIGYVGSTGLSVAPHCHYEIIKNGVKINPINYFYNDLTPEEYEKVIEQASRPSQPLS
ncbi:MAG: M23 family metallopeptidase [Bacteroidales bacterium]|jgi:murein DD-endopeptidase MepM/ murein hydrolase activator NlpD|nr:M23 family metallopeptidase [Bacteroidales bacterium]MDD4213464.1 M23 family metallopeptidase [Bacteroidales bacterium]